MTMNKITKMKLSMKTKMKKNMQAYVSSDEANIDKLHSHKLLVAEESISHSTGLFLMEHEDCLDQQQQQLISLRALKEILDSVVVVVAVAAVVVVVVAADLSNLRVP